MKTADAACSAVAMRARSHDVIGGRAASSTRAASSGRLGLMTRCNVTKLLHSPLQKWRENLQNAFPEAKSSNIFSVHPHIPSVLY
jgi:hypothetical protein